MSGGALIGGELWGDQEGSQVSFAGDRFKASSSSSGGLKARRPKVPPDTPVESFCSLISQRSAADRRLFLDTPCIAKEL